MNHTQVAKFYRQMGHKVEQTPGGVWISGGPGFFLRVPAYETTPPTADEVDTLFRRHRLIGLRYTLEPGSGGKAGGIYFMRDREYDIPHLQPKERRKTRRGQENCQIRPMGFDELQRLGMPLNLDTLARQRRDDPLFSDAERWARFCRAGAAVEGAQVWGAFVGDELATYTVIFRVGSIVSFVYTMSRTELMDRHSSPALTFTVTQTMIRNPEIEAVCYGPEGLSDSDGLDMYKQRMGFEKEPVVFAVQLRPVVRRALLNPTSRRVISAVTRRRPESDFYQRVQSILDIAALS